ncbi:unnamed protein product [Effrenium voratum]|uniref:Uncharacterized protein n=1 Tax=Effrenium voratum TaxID=2562239 RepID=A0AA36J956_9DINO|nr:unnamed protein product [Effrenium voratum]
MGKRRAFCRARTRNSWDLGSEGSRSLEVAVRERRFRRRARLGLAAQEAWEDLWNLRISSQAADRFVAGFLLLTRSASLCLLGLRQASCPHVCLQRGIGRPGHKIDEWQIGRTATTWTLTGPSEYIPTPVIIRHAPRSPRPISSRRSMPTCWARMACQGAPASARALPTPGAPRAPSPLLRPELRQRPGTTCRECRPGWWAETGTSPRCHPSHANDFEAKTRQSESPRQDEVPSAGRVSTRFSWAADMVPHSPQPKRNMRNMQSLESASPRSTAGTSLGTGLIRSSAAQQTQESELLTRRSLGGLTTGFYAEEPDTLLDSFLGARKGRSPFASPSPGASPLTSPRSVSATPQSRGFGSLSWGHVSAGGYGPEVAARQAAGTSHRLWRPKDSDITTFKEPFLRHRERVRDQRARSPPRWK